MDNAAPLCFDCHMYAGSDYYSQKHPRGTKYTIAEIKRGLETDFTMTSPMAAYLRDL